MPLFDLIELPFCRVILVGSWNEPSHRYFLAYRSLGSFRHVLGLSVVDEFATFSSPIFFAPNAILGKIYNAGISLGHQRGPDMDIDMGWPPLCVGIDEPAPRLPEKWEEHLLSALKSPNSGKHAELRQVDEYRVQSVQIGQTFVYATDAPLLPNQLRRICQISNKPFSISFSTGNRITRQENGSLVKINAASEALLDRFLQAL